MRSLWRYIPISLAFSLGARAETLAERPALTNTKPIAACKLQALPETMARSMNREVVSYTLQRPPENPLDNYEQTPLGDGRMPTTVDSADPWQRLLLLGPKRPVVVDLAVFIDGRPFRESREAWIDQLLDSATGNKSAGDEGTKSAESASEAVSVKRRTDSAPEQNEATETATENGPVVRDEAPGQLSEQKDKHQEDGEPAQVPGMKAQYRQVPTMTERLQSYLAAGGGTVERDEVRWLIAEWGTGPPVLLLGPSLSWQRAGVAPLLALLDHDQDGGLSAAEVAATNNVLHRIDMNADEVVDASELRRSASRPAATPFDTEHSLLIALDEQTDWEALAVTFARVYKQTGAQTALMLPSPARELLTQPADITLRVDFGATEQQTGVAVLATSSVLSDAANDVTATNEVVVVDLGADYIEFSAAQGNIKGNEGAAATQIAIGAAIDGNPLLRLVDRDNDDRLTTREQQDLSGILAALDRDRDGAVAAREMPMPIRFAVTRGPHVHELLATPVGAARAIVPRESAPAAPAWFASMDKNHDGDLSRSEFLGDGEQFRQIDSDGDGLVSIAEALKANASQ